MNEREPSATENEQPGQTAEVGEHLALRPRIYVASLSDYNAGRLHGRWLDAGLDVDELQAAIASMLAASPQPGAEEWAIHDYEGFGPLRVGEYESIERVARLGQGIAAHGEAFAAWASITEDSDPTDSFDDAYRGPWASAHDYASELLDDLGADDALAGLPQWLQPHVYLDTEGFARDLELSGDITTVEAADGGVYVFDAKP